MQHYSLNFIVKVRNLRSLGKTYSEIRKELNRSVPKSTLSEWCSKVKLPSFYEEKIKQLNTKELHKGRLIALASNKIKREKLLQEIKAINLPISKEVDNNLNVAKIALSMLCLGEASKSKGGSSSFYLGNSDPKIIILFLSLLKKCFPSFTIEKIRCTVQCREDQDTGSLESYWQQLTGVPKRLFYKTRIDTRTVGKPTKKTDYKGVLRINYFDNRIWFDLESLAELIYNQLLGPVA